MKTNEKDILLIEDFLDGKLSGDQLKDFNDKLKSDKHFAVLLETRKKLEPEYRKAVEYEQLKNTVGDIIGQESRTFLGIYQWSSRVTAEEYPQSFIFGMMTKRAVPETVRHEIIPAKEISGYINDHLINNDGKTNDHE